MENYTPETAPEVVLSGGMSDLLTGERVTTVTLPPYGFGIFTT